MTHSEYQTRKCRSRDADQLALLLDICFGITNSKPLSLINWKFFTKTSGRELIAYRATDISKKTVAFYCNKQIPITDGLKKYKTGVCLDMCTHPDHRGKGLISVLSTQVYKELTAKNYLFSLGFSNEQGVQVDKHAKGYKYHVVGRLETLYKPLVRYKTSSCSINKLHSFTQQLPLPKQFLQFETTTEYLHWRYIDKPGNQFELLQISQKGRVIAHAVIMKLLQKVVLHKLIGTINEQNFPIIIDSINNYYFKQNYHLLAMTILPNMFWKRLIAQTHFLPTTFQKKSYYLTVRPHTNNAEVNKKILNSENWLVMGGDII